MPRPSTEPTWATTGGTRTEPSSGEKASGFVAGDRTPAKKGNWLIGVLSDWVGYFADFIDSSDEFVYPTPPRRSVLVPMSAALAQTDGSILWDIREVSVTSGAAPMWFSIGRASYLYFDLNGLLPSGATNIAVDVIIQPEFAGTGATRSAVRVEKYTPDLVTPTTGAVTAGTEVTDDGSTNIQRIHAQLTDTVDKSLSLYRARIRSSNDGSGPEGDYVTAVLLSYDDPGPRTW
jgi:hypothetical protein